MGLSISLRSLAYRCGALLALIGWALAGLAADAAPEMVIEVAHDGETYVVNALLFAPVPIREAWAALTDFDRMSSFVPNLSESRITSRSGNQLVVEQKGVARFGVLSFAFESVREVELRPYDMVLSRNIRGNMRKLESLTRLAQADGGTRISYQVEAIPGAWFPGFVGKVFLKHEIREQFEAIVREMVRRHDGGAGAVSVDGGSAR